MVFEFRNSDLVAKSAPTVGNLVAFTLFHCNVRIT